MPLLAFHMRGDGALRFAKAEPWVLERMQGYAGSVAFNGSGQRAAITSPRGGRVMAWPSAGGLPDIWSRPDVCGLAPAPDGWTATDGLGGVVSLSADLRPRPLGRHSAAFDDHLSSVATDA